MSGGHVDGDFAWKIRNGRDEMPAWGEELDDAEIWNLVSFIQ
jgi:mono/diheme cytochrome c family protein